MSDATASLESARDDGARLPGGSPPPRRRPQIVRVILLVVLGVLLTTALKHASSFDPKHIQGMAFSADGRELFVFRGVYNAAWELNETTSEVQVWDPTTGRLLRSAVTGGGKLAQSANQEFLIDFTRDGHVRLLHPNTFAPVKEWRLPKSLGSIRVVESTEELLIVASENDAAAPVTCLSALDLHVVEQVSDDFPRPVLSRDGARLYISQRRTGGAGDFPTNVFEVKHDSLEKLSSLTFNGIAYAANSNVVFAGLAGSTVLHDVQRGETRAWSPPATLGLTWAVVFSPDGKFVRSIHGNGVVATFEAKTGAFVSQQQLSGLSEGLANYAFSPDDRLLAGTTDNRQVRVWDLTTGKLLSRFPDPRSFRLGLIGAYFLWRLLLVINGTRIKWPRPWLDAFLVNVAPLSVLIVYAAVRPRDLIHPALIAVCLAWLTAILGMVIVWWIHGRGRWSLRLTGMVAGLAGVAAALLASGHNGDQGIWNVMLGAVAYIAVLTIVLSLWRWRRLTIARSGHVASPPGSDRWQLPLQDLLWLTAAAALLIGVLRFAVPGMRDAPIVAYVSLQGASLAVTVGTAAWAAFSPRWFIVRWSATAIVAALCGAAPYYAFTAITPDPLWWSETLHGAAALIAVLGLGVFRMHGYRLSPSCSPWISPNVREVLA